MTTSHSQMIIQGLKEINNTSVIEFAQINNVSRQSVYSAISGNGSRNIRVAIAKAVKTKPSFLWQHLDYEVVVIDDYRYSNGR